MVASWPSQGGHNLNHTLLYQPFYSNRDHNLQNGCHADNKLTDKSMEWPPAGL